MLGDQPAMITSVVWRIGVLILVCTCQATRRWDLTRSDVKGGRAVRYELWEIDFWQRVFDWEPASFVAYPSWWSGGDAREPELDPSDFLNASWAKLYIPSEPAQRWTRSAKSAAVTDQPTRPVVQGTSSVASAQPCPAGWDARLASDVCRCCSARWRRLSRSLRRARSLFRGARVNAPTIVPDIVRGDCRERREGLW